MRQWNIQQYLWLTLNVIKGIEMTKSVKSLYRDKFSPSIIISVLRTYKIQTKSTLLLLPPFVFFTISIILTLNTMKGNLFYKSSLTISFCGWPLGTLYMLFFVWTLDGNSLLNGTYVGRNFNTNDVALGQKTFLQIL